MSSKATGLDVSSWQHPGGRSIDWEKVAEEGYTFALIKASQGATYTSPYLADDVIAAHKAGLIVGAYHFFEPNVDAGQQANTFIAACMGHVLELGAWLDWEPPEMAQWEVVAQYNAIIEKIEEARTPCGLYCDSSWYEIIKAANLVIKRLWIANPSGDPLPPNTMIEQGKTESVPGIIGPVDIDSLLNIRGIDIPRPPKAAELPFLAAPTEDEKPADEEPAKDDEVEAHDAPVAEVSTPA